MKKLFSLIIIAFPMMTSLSAFSQSNPQNQVIAYFRTGVKRNAINDTAVTITSTAISSVLNTYGIPARNVRSTFPSFNEADTMHAEIGESTRQMDWARVFTITVVNTATKNNFITALQGLSETLYAETDGTTATNIIPVDGRFAQQWNMHNNITPNADIHAEAAWDIFTGNPNSIIGIIDDGVDIVHSDLAAKINGGDIGFTISHDAFLGDFSHGTHVAGIAAAVTNNANNNGVAGVDWQARLQPRHVIGNGSSDGVVSQAIRDAVNSSPNVWTLNNSWSTRNQDNSEGRYSTTLRAAFAFVYRNNRLSCAAMGNHHTGADNANDVTAYPAGFNTGLIAVGATDINDNVTGFSARGPHIDVSAPGNNILSTNFNNNYVVLSGTSMATPHVSGLASLLKGFNTNLANDDIEQIIRLTADDANGVNNPGFDNQMGTGRINAQRALQSLQAPNTLQHLSTTGGTIFSTTSSQVRTFLGVPGFADAAYVVKRSEVRTNVIFPTAMCNLIGAWGRGIGTTGYREENGRSFGEGICEVVPGTLTNTGATLRTYIYEVWTVLGQYVGFTPASTANVVFQYTVLGVPQPSINGDNSFCTTSNLYTINNLLPNTSVTWSASPTGIAQINSPTAAQTPLTKTSNGQITLNAAITNGCGVNQNANVTKTVIVGSPSTPTYINVLPDVCQQYGFNTNQIAGATSYTWQFHKNPYSNNEEIFPNKGSNVKLNIDQGSGSYNVGVTAVNACGSSSMFYITTNINCGGSPHVITVSPNPSTGDVTVSTPSDASQQLMADAALNSTSSKSKTVSTPSKIYQIKVLGQAGNLLKQFSYPTGITSTNINLSSFANGVYILQIYDNVGWTSKQVVILK